MSLMINQNITSLNAWRNLGKTDRSMSTTMEKLSSGLRINKASDDPSGLVISEQMRAQVVGLKSAIKNSEKGISMIQTAEGALDKVHALLDKARGLALDSANSATSDANMLAANQAELDNIIETITRISDNTQYGTKKLLNGDNANGATVTSAGGTGISTTSIVSSTGLEDGVYNLAVSDLVAGTSTIAQGTSSNIALGASNTSRQASDSLSEMAHTLVLSNKTAVSRTDAAVGTPTSTATFASAGVYTGTTDQTYTIRVKSGGGGALLAATPPNLAFEYSTNGGTSWNDLADDGGYSSGEAIAVANGITFSFTGADATTVVAGDSWTIAATAASITASLDGGAAQKVYASQWANAELTSGLDDGGSAYFNLATATNGTGTITVAKSTYNATLTEAATGTAGVAVANFKASAGEVTFSVDANKSMTVNMENLTAAGTVQFTNADNSLVFQIGANENQTVKIAIGDIAAEMLATNVTNDSGFASLSAIKIDTAAKATDALKLIDEAIDQVSVIRGDLGAFQANTLEANLDSLRVTSENLQASESVIRDTDMAAEMASFTKFQIMMQAGTAMLAQANQIPNNILQLLRG